MNTLDMPLAIMRAMILAFARNNITTPSTGAWVMD